MFGMVRRQRRRDRDRALFHYWDGQKARRIDPLRVWRELANHDKMDLDTMPAMADEGQEPETTTVVDAFCEVFDVHRWDDASGTGLTDSDILNLINQLQGYFAALKKNTSLGVISSEPTDLGSSTPMEDPG